MLYDALEQDMYDAREHQVMNNSGTLPQDTLDSAATMGKEVQEHIGKNEQAVTYQAIEVDNGTESLSVGERIAYIEEQKRKISNKNSIFIKNSDSKSSLSIYKEKHELSTEGLYRRKNRGIGDIISKNKVDKLLSEYAKPYKKIMRLIK